MNILKTKRNFVAHELKIESWSTLKSYYEDLLHRDISTQEQFDSWLQNRSELAAIVEEDSAWRYIKMTINTKDKTLADAYTFFVSEIQPKLAPYEDKLNKKFHNSEFSKEENKTDGFKIMRRSIVSALKLFQEENVALEAKEGEKSQEFGAISGAQTIEWEEKEITMQKASSYLKSPDEVTRRSAFEKISKRRSKDENVLNELFSELIQLRHQIAINAGFKNYRDYKFEALGRFDYTKEDCFEFHNAIKKEIVPIVKEIQQNKLKEWGKDKFKPWDLSADPKGLEPLKPFETGKEMLDGTIQMFDNIDPYFGDCLRKMEELQHLDLESKDGKAPGGYNYPLYEVGVPFIFMNAVGLQRDLVTMVHEGGHAIHSFLSRDLELTSYKELPSEVAELASMAMELLSMEQWSAFYNEDDLKRAKKEQLETVLKVLPWIGTIDEFQHWIYENPNHSLEERYQKWEELGEEYGTGLVDWSGFEKARKIAWQKQMHLFEVPFYYIEYGFAQLGAIGVWQNSQSDFASAIEKYKQALKLGYTASIPEIYATAGVEFNFSQKYLHELTAFLKEELKKVER